MSYSRARSSWSDWPLTTTPVRARDLEQWDKATNELKNVQLDPRDYGTIGSGSDQTAINAAIVAAAANGGTVLLGQPDYVVTGQINQQSNVWLRGAGKDTTTITVADSANASAISSNAIIENAHVSDLTIDANKSHQSGTSYGIALTSCSKTSVRDVRITNALTRGIYYWGNTDSLIAFCDVENSGAANLGAIGIAAASARIRAIGNRVDTPGGHGIALEGANPHHIVLTDNIVTDPAAGYIGIALGSGNQYITVGDNVVSVSEVTTNCIDTGSCFDITVTGNVCSGGRTGIDCDTGFRQNITGNTCRGQEFSGISAVGPAGVCMDILISANLISNAGRDGIGLDSVINAIVANNIVKNSSRSSAGTYNGITCRTTNSITQDVIIDGNRCYDDQGTKTQGYGIRSYGTSDYLLVMANNTRGNLTGGVTLVGANNNYSAANNL